MGCIDKCSGAGGVNMRKAQIYIKNIENRKKYTKLGGFVAFQLGKSLPPSPRVGGGGKNMTDR